VTADSFHGANVLISRPTKDRSVHVVGPTPAVDIDGARFVTLRRTPI
jgi:hypothetical protein